MLIEQSYRISYRRLSARPQKTLQDLSPEVQSVKRAGDEGEAAQFGRAVLKKRVRFEREERFLV